MSATVTPPIALRKRGGGRAFLSGPLFAARSARKNPACRTLAADQRRANPSRPRNGHSLRPLAAMIESGPMPAIHGVVRWRLVDLAQWLLETFRVRVARQTLSRELRAMGYRKLSARPRHHAQVDGAIEAFKKPSRSGVPPAG